MASREPVIVCQKVATAQGAATAALRYCRASVEPSPAFCRPTSIPIVRRSARETPKARATA